MIPDTRLLMKLLFIPLVLMAMKSSLSFAQASGAGEGGASSNFHYEATLSGGNLGLSSSSSNVDLAFAFYYKPFRTDMVQVGTELGYISANHQGSSADNFDFLAGIAINLGNLSNAFYCMGGLAMKGGGGSDVNTSSTDPNGIGYHFLCGKRIPIGGNPSWVFKPSVGVIAGGTSGMVFRPLSVSYLF